MAKLKIIINDDGELQSIYISKEFSDIEVSVIDYYEDADKAKTDWKNLHKEEKSGKMVAIW